MISNLLVIASAATLGLAAPTLLTRGASTSCPANTPASCTSAASSGSVNTCCVNSPGGAMLQTQFWDTAPVTGPSDSWTVHGLWPDNCDGTFQSNCDSARAYTNISAILASGGGQATLDYMKVYWKDYNNQDEQFWAHEWETHGTCITTLDTKCYSSYVPQQEVVDFFAVAVKLFKSVPTYQWLTAAGIVPSTSATYTLAQLRAVAQANFGKNAVWGCNGNALNQVFWGYTTQGSVQDGTFIPSTPLSSSSCPSTGIQWLPKTGSSSPPSSATSSAGGSTSTGTPPSSGSKGFVNVIDSGTSNGCLISTGKWMVGVTCAGYTVSGSTSAFTLATSKGPCQVNSGTFVCGSGLSATTFSSDSSNNLVYSGSSNFGASAAPSGQTQVTVVTGNQARSLKLQFQ